MKDKIRFIKFIDKVFGSFLIKLCPAPDNKPNKVIKVRHLLVIRPGGMGDALLLLPVLKAVKKKYPHVMIDILCESRNHGVFQSIWYIEKSYLYHSPVNMSGLFKRFYDVIIDTEQSHFLSSIICRILKGHIKIGFAVNGREKLFHHSIPYRHDQYEAELFWNLFKAIFTNLPNSFQWDFPYFPIKAVPKDHTYHNLTAKKAVCLFPGATVEERQWPEKRWAGVIDQLIEKNCLPILLGGKMEKKLCKDILHLCRKSGTINMCGKLSILETARLFQGISLLISTDSGILHLGVLCDVATISLFGSGIAAKWGPRENKHVVLKKNLECSPCTLFGTTPPCPNQNSCMVKIQEHEVSSVATSLLGLN